MYELIILAHLMRGVAHGYLIAKIINDIIGPYARVSNGRLYPLLAKLELSGLIAVDTQIGPGDRQLRRYRITEEGKRRFHELMMDTTSNPGGYQDVFLQKVAYLDFLTPVERLRLIDHYINYSQAHVLHLNAEADDTIQHHTSWCYEGDNTAFVESILSMTYHMIDRWQLELEWARKLRERECSKLKESECPEVASENVNRDVNRNHSSSEGRQQQQDQAQHENKQN